MPYNDHGGAVAGESAAVRFSQAPGKRGLEATMDNRQNAKPGKGAVDSRNPGVSTTTDTTTTHNQDVVERNSRLGVMDAWKSSERK